MSVVQPGKDEIIKKFGKKAGDTGSPEVQVALFTQRIKAITEHLATHKKDVHSRRGLIQLVNDRRKQLGYLKSKDVARYQALIKELGLRR